MNEGFKKKRITTVVNNKSSRIDKKTKQVIKKMFSGQKYALKYIVNTIKKSKNQ